MYRTKPQTLVYILFDCQVPAALEHSDTDGARTISHVLKTPSYTVWVLGRSAGGHTGRVPMAARGLLAQDVGAYACVRLQTSTHARVRPLTGGQETLTTCPSITSAERQVIQASHVRGRAGAGALTPTSIRLDGRLPQQQVWPHVRT